MTPLPNSSIQVDEEMESHSQSQVGKSKRRNESVEDKKARRKEERKKRRLHRLEIKAAAATNQTILLSKSVKKEFNKIWDRETSFVMGVLNVLPEVRNPHLHDNEEEKMDDFLLDDEGATKTQQKREKFLAKMKANAKAKDEGSSPTRAISHEELKERLHAKLELLGQKKNERKRLRKQKKKELKKQTEDGSDKKKKFTSKANPNLKNQQKNQSSGATIKDEIPSETIVSGGISNGLSEKTPLRKKPVVKSNGDIVYSKFDFISEDKRKDKSSVILTDGKKNKNSGKPKPENLLKNVQKQASKVARLETMGKTSEAVSIVETQKWDSALKRAQGEKIRDDPTLLKKSIKKQEKRKQVSKKKWQERTERVDQQKTAKQDKRKANIQSRKDEKVKKIKKQQRKKGRLV